MYIHTFQRSLRSRRMVGRLVKISVSETGGGLRHQSDRKPCSISRNFSANSIHRSLVPLYFPFRCSSHIVTANNLGWVKHPHERWRLILHRCPLQTACDYMNDIDLYRYTDHSLAKFQWSSAAWSRLMFWRPTKI